jgi:hypothetical protein
MDLENEQRDNDRENRVTEEDEPRWIAIRAEAHAGFGGIVGAASQAQAEAVHRRCSSVHESPDRRIP